MRSIKKDINYTEYAIEWMRQHEEPLPPDQKLTLESIPSYLNRKMGEKNALHGSALRSCFNRAFYRI